MKSKTISVFFSYSKDASKKLISILSKLKMCKGNANINVHILNKGIEAEDKNSILAVDGLKYFFDDVSSYISKDEDYYKFAIVQIAKCDTAIYIDPKSSIDIDINRLLSLDLGDYYVGAYHDIAFDGKLLSSYTESVLGISHYLYVNDDCAVFNIRALKGNGAYDRFMLYDSFTSYSINPSRRYLTLPLRTEF